jgi:hypothetical protein
MLQRCTNEKSTGWADYGGRGISVCERWFKYENFVADMGEPPEKYSLNRINNDADYEPGNCSWATQTEQNRNTRKTSYVTISGNTIALPDACDAYGIKKERVFRLVRTKHLTHNQAFHAIIDKIAPKEIRA